MQEVRSEVAPTVDVATKNIKLALDPTDPIDKLLPDYKAAIVKDETPSVTEQRVMIGDMQKGNPEAARELVRTHVGMIAAIAYQYKGAGRSSSQLLYETADGFQKYAAGYRGDVVGFNDFVISSLNSALCRKYNAPAALAVFEGDAPMERLLKFMNKVRTPATKNPTASKLTVKEHLVEYPDIRPGVIAEQFKGLSSQQQGVLRLIHLPFDEIAAQLSVNPSTVKSHFRAAKNKLRIHNRIAIAVALDTDGLLEDVVPCEKPFSSIFSDMEMRLVPYLHLPPTQIAKVINRSKSAVSPRLSNMREQTGARSHIELAVLARRDSARQAEALASISVANSRPTTPLQEAA